MRWLSAGLILGLWASVSVGQTCQAPEPAKQPDATQTREQTPEQTPEKRQGPKAADLPPSEAPPRSDDADATAGEVAGSTPQKADDDRNFSSSREGMIDVSPPKDDLKEHPNSAAALSRSEGDEPSDVEEFHPWNPMKALKDVEVGDYYFKRKNYKGALERYKDALFYKENDAVATFRLAVCQEKMADPTGALSHYAAYLKILPHGEFAEAAREAVDRLGGTRDSAKDEAAVPAKR